MFQVFQSILQKSDIKGGIDGYRFYIVARDIANIAPFIYDFPPVFVFGVGLLQYKKLIRFETQSFGVSGFEVVEAVQHFKFPCNRKDYFQA